MEYKSNIQEDSNYIKLLGKNVGIGIEDPGIYRLYVNGNTFINGSLQVNGGITATIFNGSAQGLTNFPTFNQNTTGNAGTVTNGVYTTGDQTIGGLKTFTSNVTALGFFNSSDSRLKNIIERDGDTIKFTWKDGRDSKIHIGYIAQEVQEKYPDQVSEDTSGMLTVNYIEVLVAKIQELENRIKQLEK